MTAVAANPTHRLEWSWVEDSTYGTVMQGLCINCGEALTWPVFSRDWAAIRKAQCRIAADFHWNCHNDNPVYPIAGEVR